MLVIAIADDDDDDSGGQNDKDDDDGDVIDSSISHPFQLIQVLLICPMLFQSSARRNCCPYFPDLSLQRILQRGGLE